MAGHTRTWHRRLQWAASLLCTTMVAACGGGAATGNSAVSTVPTASASASDVGTSTVDSSTSSAQPGTGASANASAGGAAGTAASGAPTSQAVAAATLLDRVDFGSASSERQHAVNADTTTAAASSGAFGLTNRQPKLVPSGTTPSAQDQLSFTVAVDPAKQNYLTVKLWGSDAMFGVLHLMGLTHTDGEVVFDQLDNDNSNGTGNPPFYGRFHYATTALPLSMTKGKTAVALSLASTGYYYDSGAEYAGRPTRSIFSAYTHTNPWFVPPAGDPTGTAPVQVGTQPPATVDTATAFRVLKRSRANIYNLDGVPDGFWNPGGTLAYLGSVIPTGTSGAPPEVIGMHMWNGPLTSKQISDINASANPVDTWRNNVLNQQTAVISLYTTIYLTPQLKDSSGNVVTGYDRYLDSSMLDRLVGLLDGQARSQGGSDSGLGGWDTSCLPGAGWGGVTSAPRTSGPWAGSRGRHSAGCLTFADQWSSAGRSVLKLLDNPQAAAAFKTRLAEMIDADLNGTPITRAAMYERMFAASANGLGFGLKALTSPDYFDKFGGTAAQAMIWVGDVYPAQLALRSLLAMFPSSDTDKQPINPATMRTIVRQLLGLDDMVFMAPATPGWRIITRGGLAETYGSLSCGYDGRYGGGVPGLVAKFALLTRSDNAMSTTDRSDAASVVRNTIAAFDNFLYPQHQISVKNDGSVVDTYALGQEDVISWRVPYGPNANGWDPYAYPLSVDPNGAMPSILARRLFLINANRQGADSIISDLNDYAANEAAWASVAGVDAATIPSLPGEPDAADFVWADVDSGALALHYKGERLFFNANYDRDKGSVNNVVRIHHVTDVVDREATVRMPFDATTVQDDGNLSGAVDGAWVVRYGRYLVVLNRSSSIYTVTMPPGSGNAQVVNGGTVPMGGSASVAAGAYAVYVMP